MKKNIYLVCIFILLSISLYPKTLFIESFAILYNGIVSESTADIIYNFLHNGNKVYAYGCSREDELTIKAQFSDVIFINRSLLPYYETLNRKQNIFYAESENEIKRLESDRVEYIQVLFSVDYDKNYRVDVDNSSLIKLKNIYGKKILIGYEVRESIKIKISKGKIYVIDGDTVSIEGVKYRFLGVDAPEIEQEYGTSALLYLRNILSNAKTVSISPADYDTYGRILAHLYIDDIPVAYKMVENKLAFQTITSFGDNGFPNISSNIIELANMQGKMPFLKPSTYRDRVKKGQTNNLTVKKTKPKTKSSSIKKKIKVK